MIYRKVFELSLLTVFVLLGSGVAMADVLAVRGERVHTMAGPVIEDGVVVIRDGRIEAVGPASDVAIPADARVLEAAVVTPGLVDAHSVVGLAGYLNYGHDQDQLESSEPIQPELRALDAYNAREPLVAWVRSFGVTTLHTGHAPGALISGQTMIVKTRGETVDEAVIRPVAMVAATLGEGALREGKKPPGTRGKAVAMLRAELTRAVEYRKKRSSDDDEVKGATDLRLEALARVTAGELPLLVTVHRHQDILAAIRVAEEFGVRLVLDGAAEAYLLTERIRETGYPVIVHPTMMRAAGEGENATFEAAARLSAAGIPLAFQAGYESYVPKTRVVLFEAAVAVAHGLAYERGLAAITLDAARLLGVDDRIGSLETGKDGDLALFDGDPFEYTSHCVATVIDGVVVTEGAR